MKTITKNGHRYAISQKAADKHRFTGWYWHYVNKMFYRFDDLPKFPVDANK